MKACKRCGTVKPLAQYSPNRSTADGRFATCTACVSEKKRNAPGNIAKGMRLEDRRYVVRLPYGVQPEWTRFVCARAP